MKKRILSTVFILCMVFLLVPIKAFAGNVYFWHRVEYTTATIYQYIGSVASVTFPNMISCYPVTKIANSTFSTVEGYTNVTNVNIPASITYIEPDTFTKCINLQSISINENNTAYSSVDGVLFNKDKTELVRYPIGKSDTSYTIPDSVTSISSYAFKDCKNLTSIDIPSGVTHIGDYAFSGCTNLADIAIPESATHIGKYAFEKCSKIESLTIPAGVTSIGEWAFSYAGIKNITFAENSSLTFIRARSFNSCTGLRSIDIHHGVTEIKNSAFYDCSGLVTVAVPGSVTSIGLDVFYYCSSLGSIFLPDNNLNTNLSRIPATAAKIIYTLAANPATSRPEATITQITLGTGQPDVAIPDTICGYGNVAIPDTICGYDIVAVTSSEQSKVGSHICKGGTATCTAKALCSICGKEEYGEKNPNNHTGTTIWENSETQHKQATQAISTAMVAKKKFLREQLSV